VPAPPALQAQMHDVPALAWTVAHADHVLPSAYGTGVRGSRAPTGDGELGGLTGAARTSTLPELLDRLGDDVAAVLMARTHRRG
jgi:hypothetical protein